MYAIYFGLWIVLQNSFIWNDTAKLSFRFKRCQHSIELINNICVYMFATCAIKMRCSFALDIQSFKRKCKTVASVATTIFKYLEYCQFNSFTIDVKCVRIRIYKFHEFVCAAQKLWPPAIKWNSSKTIAHSVLPQMNKQAHLSVLTVPHWR